MISKIKIWRFGLYYLALSCAMAAGSAYASNYCDHPEVQSVVRKSYPGWRIVQLNDLRPEDRTIWIKEHGIDCPGIFDIKLKSRSKIIYATTSFKSTPRLKQALLIIGNGSGSTSVSTLSQPEDVAYLSVISKAPLGGYVGLDGHKVNVTTGAILYEAIESGVLLYYPSGDGFRSMVISD